MVTLIPTCPSCNSQNTKIHTNYDTMNHGQRVIHKCNECERFFASTFNTFLAGIRKPISLIIQVMMSRTEGLGFNAACRTFEIAKNTLLDWEMKFSGIKQTLLLYALVHSFIKLTIEGDEVYTRVGKNVPESKGWGTHGQGKPLPLGTQVRKERPKTFQKSSKNIEQTRCSNKRYILDHRWGAALWQHIIRDMQ